MKTNRGLNYKKFKDDYGEECIIQDSSSIDPHIWLGVIRPEVKIMYKDAVASGIDVQKDDPNTNECGFCTIPLPEDVQIFSLMHLNRKQARELAKQLNFFARNGFLKEDENDDES